MKDRTLIAVQIVTNPQSADPLSLSLVIDAPLHRGVPISGRLVAGGGTGGYVYSLPDKPAWLNVNSVTGEFSGSPDAIGHVQITAHVEDSSATAGDHVFSLDVVSRLTGRWVMPTPGIGGNAYEYQFAVDGATGSVSWEDLDSPPFGLATSHSGLLHGTCSFTFGFTYWSIRATDSGSGDTLDIAVVMEVRQAIFLEVEIAPPPFYAGIPSSFQFVAHGGIGQISYYVNSASTPLPSWLSLSISGVLSGAAPPDIPNGWSQTVLITASDSTGATNSATYNLSAFTITSPDGSITPGGTLGALTLKVTPGRYDPAGAADSAQAASLQIAANLSDVADAATARANIGAGVPTNGTNGQMLVSNGVGAFGTPLTRSTDGTLSGNSDTNIPSQKAVKTYVDNAVTSATSFQGSISASSNPNYPAATKGQTWVISTAGRIGGASGTLVDAGDMILAIAANAGGTQASVGSSWVILEHNLVGALLSANNLSDIANASTARANLGLGSAATQNTGTSGGAVPLLNGANTWSVKQTISTTATGTYQTLCDYVANRTFAPSADGIALDFVCGNGTRGTHDFAALVAASAPGSGDGGGAILDLYVGGTASSHGNNARAVRAYANLGGSVVNVQVWAGGAQIAKFTSGGLTVPGLVLPGTTAQYVRGDGSIATMPAGGSGTVTSVAQGNGMSGSTITTSGTISLGTPSSCTASTVNGVTSTSHTHAITGFMPTTGGTFTGAITAPGVTDSSDAKFKRDVRDLRDGLDIVCALLPRRFHNELTGNEEVGFVAQELRHALPEVVSTDENGDLAVAYARLVAPIVSALQTLDTRLRVLESRL